MGDFIFIIIFCFAIIYVLNLIEDLYLGKFMFYLFLLLLGKFKIGLIENSML